ncbi:hypothetical protein EDB81DRAFT_796790 [Dactylonectria macrodidyma]|uniref:Uncharacterized protein n=1 Tax=Dactylonectria macrodidyma TaxID=307937 RepID=A0A9P9ET25_9HYPO|nr:hypothetical protein EDB81DRAFT_796790 [Dactylonectria macrodidyma]
MPPSGPFSVVVHPYESLVRRSCAYEIGPTSARNALVVIGGLGDGPHTLPSIRTIAKHLEDAQDSDFSIFEFRLRSSFIGFGTSNLSNDVADISALVKYIRGLGKEKIVLLGHSTGCQDCMEYADYAKHGNEPVDAFIMQGCVSDREAFELVMPNPQPSLDLAAKMIAEGKANDVMPMDMIPSVLNAPISAYRFQSLTAKGGDDDYFSDDFDDETISKFWARFQKPVLALHSAEDEYVPDRVDQAALNKRYQNASAMVSPLSGVIPGASHTVAEPEAQKWFAKRVGDFLATL